MPQTGLTERIRISGLEQRRQQVTAFIMARFTHAFDTYRWQPLSEFTQAAAWDRILEFAGHLLGAYQEPHAQATTTLATQRWLKRLNIDADDAIGMLLNPENVPSLLLHEIEKAAIEEALMQLDDSLMQHAYGLLSAAERVACVQRMREAFPIMNGALNGLPSWSYIEELPTLHRMCVEEMQGADLQQAAPETR